tara:strand:+ start:522 stop:1244 length:723 start_codon:yes stop_codon:yes gene_type:complete
MLLPIIGFSQWNFETRNDPFEGKTKMVMGKGTNGNFPYNNPVLGFRQNGGTLEIIIADAGSTACGDVRVAFSFGNSDDIISFEANEGLNGDSAFLDTNDLGAVVKLVDGLKKKSIVYVEYRTGCSYNRFQISLNGSTRELSKIFDASWESKTKSLVKDYTDKELNDIVFRMVAKADFDCNYCTKIQDFERIKESIIKQVGSKVKSISEIVLVEQADQHRIFVTISGNEKELIPVEKKVKD